jgi:hypothetical protein
MNTLPYRPYIPYFTLAAAQQLRKAMLLLVHAPFMADNGFKALNVLLTRSMGIS